MKKKKSCLIRFDLALLGHLDDAVVMLETLIPLEGPQDVVNAAAVLVEALQVLELVAALRALKHLHLGVGDHVAVQRVAAGKPCKKLTTITTSSHS